LRYGALMIDLDHLAGTLVVGTEAADPERRSFFRPS
jgi:hypothetical protein